MGSLTVRYHNILRTAAGLAEETVALPGDATLYALLEALVAGHGSPLHEMLLESDGSMVSYLVVFVNRKLVSGDPHGVLLADGDEILLFPANAVIHPEGIARHQQFLKFIIGQDPFGFCCALCRDHPVNGRLWSH